MLKIRPEHFELIKNKIKSIGADKIATHKTFLQSPENPRKPKDLEKRLRWDCLKNVIDSKWICDNLYSYLNDDHIDSALRQIMETI